MAAVQGRPAHIPGPTYVAYTPNGRHLISVGTNNSIRIFDRGGEDEPRSIDNSSENHTCVCASNTFFIAGSADGTVAKYSIKSGEFDGLLVRCSVPVRGLDLSPDGEWVAVASEELVVKVVRVSAMDEVRLLRDQPRGNGAVAFDHTGTHVAVSCSDGIVYVYSLGSDTPRLVTKVQGLIPAADFESDASSAAKWHPRTQLFVAPTSSNDINMVGGPPGWARIDEFRMANAHSGAVTALAWSPSGGILATAGTDNRLALWDVLGHSLITIYNDLAAPPLSLSWQADSNVIAYSTVDGEIFVHEDVVPAGGASLLTDLSLSRRLLDLNPAGSDAAGAAAGAAAAGRTALGGRPSRPRLGSPDSLDQLLGDIPDGPDAMMVDDEDGGFVDDDDGAGYANPAGRAGPKRRRVDSTAAGYPSGLGPYAAPQTPIAHQPFQPGSTPWKANRRYLCLNLIGTIWTIDQQSHHTVTVEFYDREFERDFHFTDPFLWDKACLATHGAVFSCPALVPASRSKKSRRGRDQAALDPDDPTAHPSLIQYRPHQSWTNRTDWRTSLPEGENVTSLALTDSFVIATTSAGYVRVFSLFGLPVKVFRQKHGPAVTCAASNTHVLTVGNGPVVDDGDGGSTCQLVYSIDDVAQDETLQSGDVVALPPGGSLQSVMFSDVGDPFIFDSDGVLLVLQHWRTRGQARWVPLLDTRLIGSGSGSESESGSSDRIFWPVAVAANKLYAIVLNRKTGSQPHFPRPLLSEFEFEVPVGRRDALEGASSGASGPDDSSRLEEAFVRHSVSLSLVQDRVGLSNPSSENEDQAESVRLAVEADKTLLQLLALECRLGEDRGMKAYELVTHFRDQSGRMLDAAEKVAVRFNRNILASKIRDLAEQRLEEQQRNEFDV